MVPLIAPLLPGRNRWQRAEKSASEFSYNVRTVILHMKLLHAIAVLGLPTIGFGQWVHYPTTGVPRKADGTPIWLHRLLGWRTENRILRVSGTRPESSPAIPT